MRTARGETGGALDDLRRALALARRAEDPQQVVPATGISAALLAENGMPEEALDLAQEAVELARGYPRSFAVFSLGLDLLFSPLAARFEGELREIVAEAPLSRWQELATACLDRDFVQAADMWAAAGSPTWEARLRLRAAEELVEKGEMAGASEQAEKAIAFYRSVGAAAYVERAKALVAGQQSA